MKILKTSVWALVLCLSVLSCSEDLENPMNISSAIAPEEVKTVLIANQLSSISENLFVNAFSQRTSGKFSKMTDCYTSETAGNTTTITFNNCTVEDSRPINGSVTATLNRTNETTGVEVTYVDLSVGGIGVSGTKNFSFPNQASSTEYSVASTMEFVLEDGQIVTQEGTSAVGLRFDTNLNKAVLYLTGAWSTTTGEDTYNAVITNEFVTVLPCNYVGQGLVEVSKNEQKVSLDFGNGECDALVTLNYPDGTTKEISLKD